MKRTQNQSGSALVPAMLIVASLAVLVAAMLSSAISGARTTVSQDDDFRLSSAVESLGGLAVENLWSSYLLTQSGVPGTLGSFRAYLQTRGIEADAGTGAPLSGEGFDLLPLLDLPMQDERTTYNGTEVESVRVVRRDEALATRLWVTVQTRSERGLGQRTRPAQRAAQLVWSVEPDEFSGFEFALLANNVNCIFCHTKIDNVERWFNADPDAYGTYERVRVGTLESLHIRNHNGTHGLNDSDADSMIAGTLYSRGAATIHDGTEIANWAEQSLKSARFDDDRNLEEDAWGNLALENFFPAGDPPQAGENLYLDYTSDYQQMVDGILPDSFPPPFPDDGGIDPGTGEPDPDAIGNRRVDDAEFEIVAASAKGVLSGGAISVLDGSDAIDNVNELGAAIFEGNTDAPLEGRVDGNVVLVGTPEAPLVIDEDIVVDGDVVIVGHVKGEGSIVARGNVYVPGDLQYLDGVDGNGLRTFGIASDGQRNALGIAAGGNVMIGDFQRPSTIQADGSRVPPGLLDIISGNPDTGDKHVDEWSFALAEMAIFNRGEWARTQPMLPGSSDEANGPPSGWTVPNPDYVEGYVPRFYGYKQGTVVPLLTEGGYYFDPTSGGWRGGPETAIAWDEELLRYADPNDPNDPLLYPTDGSPLPAVSTIAPDGGWIQDEMYKLVVEYVEALRPRGQPLSIDGLVYTNNSIYSIVNRRTKMQGRTIVNGALVAADIGLLAPGIPDPDASNKSAQSDYAIGLQLNYDDRVKDMLNVLNPTQVGIRRTLWDPAVGVQ